MNLFIKVWNNLNDGSEQIFEADSLWSVKKIFYVRVPSTSGSFSLLLSLIVILVTYFSKGCQWIHASIIYAWNILFFKSNFIYICGKYFKLAKTFYY